jgi:hypothetical protein
MATGNKPARGSRLCRAGANLSRAKPRGPSHESTRLSPSTACAELSAQLRSCVGGSSLQLRTSNLQNLIANGILERPLTHSKQTTAMPSNREKFRVPRTRKRASEVTFGGEAKKKLIATVPNSKIMLSSLEPTLSQFLTATKTGFPDLRTCQPLDGLGQKPRCLVAPPAVQFCWAPFGAMVARRSTAKIGCATEAREQRVGTQGNPVADSTPPVASACNPSGEIPFLPQGRQMLPGTQGNPSRQTLFVSKGKGNYLAGSAIVSIGASGVPEVYNPGRFLRRHP